jgi:C_GCAxxG_C_C family probable redox protein
MADIELLKAKVEELATRDWEMPAIKARYEKLSATGIPSKKLNRNEIIVNKKQILKRVQLRGEEYNFLLHNCACSAALAVMEEFGLGSMEIAKALTPFPGFSGTGWICGGVTAGLIVLGLYFGSENLMDPNAAGTTIMAGQKFMSRFEAQVGGVLCPTIQEKVVFGRYMDPGSSPKNMERFIQEKGIEKCGLPPGIGAKLASEIIIESFE